MKVLFKQFLALLTLAFCLILFARGGAAAIPLALGVAFVAMAAIASPAAILRGQLGAAPDTVDVASELNLSVILDSALETFKRTILPLTVFSTVFRDIVLQGTDKVEVPYYPLQGIKSKDFNGTYDFSTGAGLKTDVRELTIDQRKYQPLAMTSSQIARLPQLGAIDVGRLKGEKLAFDVIQDVLGLVTAANFPSVAFTGAASTFDSDDVVDIRTACEKNATGPLTVADGVTTNGSKTITSATAAFTFSDIGMAISGTGIPAGATVAGVTNATTATLSANATADGTGITFTMSRPVIPWPQVGRGLIVNPDYEGALLKDANFRRDLTVAGQTTVNTAQLPTVYGFGYGATAAIPGNGENLVGFACFRSALLVGFSPIAPADEGKVVDYRVVTDEETGISIEYRKWFSPDDDKVKEVIETNYGRAVGEKLALKRMKSA
jgi:hypothetical protein